MTKHKPDVADSTRERFIREGLREFSPGAWTHPDPLPGTPKWARREEAIQAAGAVFARILAEMDAKTPRQAAQDAYRPGGASVDELENLIRAERGLPPVDRAAQAPPESPEPAPAPARPRRKPRAAQKSAEPAAAAPPTAPDPLAAVAGMSREEKRALAEALAVELGG